MAGDTVVLQLPNRSAPWKLTVPLVMVTLPAPVVGPTTFPGSQCAVFQSLVVPSQVTPGTPVTLRSMRLLPVLLTSVAMTPAGNTQALPGTEPDKAPV